MSTSDELRDLRNRLDALTKRANRLGGDAVQGTDCQVGYVFDGGAIPTVLPAFYSVNPVSLSADGIEGAAPIIAIDTANSYRVAVVSSQPPIAGDWLIGRAVDFRWAADYPGSTPPGTVLPGCNCKGIPSTLTMTSSKPSSNNHMFQDATFAYGPTPAALAPLALGTNCFLSTSQFLDYATNDMFWYYMGCYLGFYTLTRVYAVSHYASPYRDQIRYRWLPGFGGNTCSPFSLTNGAMYSGGDTSCIVSITA